MDNSDSESSNNTDSGMDDESSMNGDDSEEQSSSDGSGPGFGVPAALGGAGGLSYLLSKRFAGGEPGTESDD